jgi:ADP-ribosyl-[dinitrogen reductase] hydrolase
MKIPLALSAGFPCSWESMNEAEKRITSTLIAYAAGDAFGAFYEFAEITNDVPNKLLVKDNWPLGGTSDDTSLTILSLLSLSESNPESASKRFLKLLRENRESLRGLGPTTRNALGLPVKDWERDSIGLTNGALMRTAMFGLIFQELRDCRNWVEKLSSNTHRDYAVSAAVLMADCFAGSEIPVDKNWAPPGSGVTNDANETLQAVLYVSANATKLSETYIMSCSLGGDTDTVAALSGALFASRNSNFEEVFSLPWLSQVDWKGISYFKDALETVFSKMAEA